MSEDSFTAITDEQYQAFIACPSFEEEYRYLIETKAITVPFAEENPRNKIIAEYFYKVINYCKSIKFNFIQTKVCCQLFEVIIKVAQTENVYGEDAKSRCTEVFKQQLLELNRSSSDADVFTPNDIKAISIYFLKSILSQLTAFQYILQRPVSEHLYETTVVVQTPIAPPALTSGEIQEDS